MGGGWHGWVYDWDGSNFYATMFVGPWDYGIVDDMIMIMRRYGYGLENGGGLLIFIYLLH